MPVMKTREERKDPYYRVVCINHVVLDEGSEVNKEICQA